MKYNPALDGIRGLAAITIVIHHALVPGFDHGRAGVDVFFVLSGYLITTLLAQEHDAGGIRFGAFYLRRARRLYPALCFMVAVAVLGGLYYAHPLHAKDVGITLAYLSDYGAAFHFGPQTPILHTWSLSVEEHFYLLWPLVVAGLMKLSPRNRLRVLVVGYLAATVWRLHVGMDAPWESYYRFDTRLSGLILGGIVAFLPPLRMGWAVLPLAALVFWHNLPLAPAILPAEWLGFALVMWARSGAPILATRPLVFLGQISYGIYLFHWPLGVQLRSVHAPWWTTLAWTLAGSLFFATVSYYTVERWFRQGRIAQREGGTGQAITAGNPG